MLVYCILAAFATFEAPEDDTLDAPEGIVEGVGVCRDEPDADGDASDASPLCPSFFAPGVPVYRGHAFGFVLMRLYGTGALSPPTPPPR